MPSGRRLWKERLENNQPYLLEWVKHQVDGPYWKNGSLRPDYDRVQVPVFLIGGWHDGYVNAMLRMYTHLKGPKKLLIGPWVHTQPHASIPGPRIDWINEASRFFAHWLRNEDTGIMKEPPVSVLHAGAHETGSYDWTSFRATGATTRTSPLPQRERGRLLLGGRRPTHQLTRRETETSPLTRSNTEAPSD